ncbi:MAG: Lrp/AsnC family transcriptional regulator [Candidatus Woesearchaeota archaeon]
MTLDKKDLQILDELCENAKLTTGQIAKRLRIPVTTVHNRIKKLEKLGVITGYTVKLDHTKLGKPMMAYILISVMYTLPNGKKIEQDELARKIKKFPEAEEVIITAGVTDIMVKVRVGTVEELNEFIIKKLRSVDGVDKTQTMIALSQA